MNSSDLNGQMVTGQSVFSYQVDQEVNNVLADGITTNINLENTYKVENAIDPTSPQDYVTLAYGDAHYMAGGSGMPADATLNYISTTNPTSGNIDMQGFLINSLGSGVLPTDAINLNQLDNAIDGLSSVYMPIAETLNQIGTSNPNTANVPMNGYYLSGLGSSASGTESVSYNQMITEIDSYIPTEIADTTDKAIINCVGPNAIDVTLNNIQVAILSQFADDDSTQYLQIDGNISMDNNKIGFCSQIGNGDPTSGSNVQIVFNQPDIYFTESGNAKVMVSSSEVNFYVPIQINANEITDGNGDYMVMPGSNQINFYCNSLEVLELSAAGTLVPNAYPLISDSATLTQSNPAAYATVYQVNNTMSSTTVSEIRTPLSGLATDYLIISPQHVSWYSNSGVEEMQWIYTPGSTNQIEFVDFNAETVIWTNLSSVGTNPSYEFLSLSSATSSTFLIQGSNTSNQLVISNTTPQSLTIGIGSLCSFTSTLNEIYFQTPSSGGTTQYNFLGSNSLNVLQLENPNGNYFTIELNGASNVEFGSSSGILNFGAQEMISSFVPVNPSDLVNLAYLESYTANPYVSQLSYPPTSLYEDSLVIPSNNNLEWIPYGSGTPATQLAFSYAYSGSGLLGITNENCAQMVFYNASTEAAQVYQFTTSSSATTSQFIIDAVNTGTVEFSMTNNSNNFQMTLGSSNVQMQTTFDSIDIILPSVGVLTKLETSGGTTHQLEIASATYNAILSVGNTGGAAFEGTVTTYSFGGNNVQSSYSASTGNDLINLTAQLAFMKNLYTFYATTSSGSSKVIGWATTGGAYAISANRTRTYQVGPQMTVASDVFSIVNNGQAAVFSLTIQQQFNQTSPALTQNIYPSASGSSTIYQFSNGGAQTTNQLDGWLSLNGGGVNNQGTWFISIANAQTYTFEVYQSSAVNSDNIMIQMLEL